MNAAFVVWCWLDFLSSAEAGTKKRAYWRAHWGQALVSLLVTALVMGAWLSGALSNVIDPIVPDDFYKGPLPVATWSSPLAGFFVTAGTDRIAKALGVKGRA